MGRTWTLAEKVERRQRRLDKRRRSELPLFAASGDTVLDSVTPLPTTEQIYQQYADWDQEFKAWQERMEQFRQQMRDRQERARGVARHYISEDQVEHIDTHIRRMYPSDPVYGAEHWSHLLADLLDVPYKGICERLEVDIYEQSYEQSCT